MKSEIMKKRVFYYVKRLIKNLKKGEKMQNIEKILTQVTFIN